MPPEYVVIGHITKDLTPDGHTIGGTATYAAITAHNLGLAVGIVTSYAPQFDLSGLPAGISIERLPASETTTFRNVYTNSGRQQFVHAIAAHIDRSAVPTDWRRSPIIHLGPLVNEIPRDMVDAFDSQSLIGVTPQGWMREWDETGRVKEKRWHSAPYILRRVDALIFSEEDVAHAPDEIDRFAGLSRIMVVTQGHGGAILYQQGQPARHFPAFVANEVDPTGAGDVFAAAFLIRLRETGAPDEATRFANAVASLSIEKPGVLGIPSRDQVEQRLKEGRLRNH